MLSPSSTRIIFGNTVTNLMLETPAAEHSEPLAVSSARKIWLARSGDMVVSARPITAALKEYACELLDLDASSIATLTPSNPRLQNLADALSPGDIRRLRTFARERPGSTLSAYALDQSTVDLALKLGVDNTGYEAGPGPELIDRVARLNTKSGFRALAEELGLNVARGFVCDGIDAAACAVQTLLSERPSVLIKIDRSSNGYGALVLNGADRGDAGPKLAAHLAALALEPGRFVVEQYLDFLSSPSAEMLVDAEGCKLTYPCGQYFRDGAFGGMITPPPELPATRLEPLIATAQAIGRRLCAWGYRGVFDLDAAICADGSLYFTEMNLRRTAGSHLHELVCRLLGEDYLSHHVWLSNTGPRLSGWGFEAGVARLRSAGLGYCRSSRCGVILTVDSSELDRQWRYLVVAPDLSEARLLEAAAAQILQFHPPVAHVAAKSRKELVMTRRENVTPEYRKLGNTGFDLSSIGFGTWQLGGGRWQGKTKDESLKLLHDALDTGVNIYDAAVVYGQYRSDLNTLESRSQELLGEAFADRRKQVYFCVKIGQFDEFSHRSDYTPARLIEQLQQAMRRLRTDYLDICLIHAPALLDVKLGQAIAVLKTLQSLGIVRAIGYSFENEPDHVLAALTQRIDVIMLQYNLIDQQCGPALQLAEEAGVGILVGGPFKRGYLTGRYPTVDSLPLADDYWSWNVTRNRGKVEKILSQVNGLLSTHGSAAALRGAALGMILDQPAVASAVVGHRCFEEVVENIALAGARRPMRVLRKPDAEVDLPAAPEMQARHSA